MNVHLGAGFMNAVEQGAGEFQLSTGFQRDGRTGVVEQSNHQTIFLHGLPAKLLGQSGENGEDTAFA